MIIVTMCVMLPCKHKFRYECHYLQSISIVVAFFTLILAESTVWMTPSMSNAIRRRTQDYPQKEIQTTEEKHN
jgi:hypothetical protein